jgi:hypothetical protein
MKLTKSEMITYYLTLSQDELIMLDAILKPNRQHVLTPHEIEFHNELRDKMGQLLRGS